MARGSRRKAGASAGHGSNAVVTDDGNVGNASGIADGGNGAAGGADLRDGAVIDPGSIAGSAGGDGGSGDASGGEPRTKRAYRRRGTAKTAGASALDLTNLNRVLLVSHTVLSQLSGIPELRLDEDEAKTLGTAIGEVLSHYDVAFMDDKTTAWVNLAQVMFGVYGTRIMAARIRKSTERAQAAERQQKEAETIHAERNAAAPGFTATTVLPQQGYDGSNGATRQ